MNKKQQRAAKIAAQQALVNGARAAGREMTAEEQAQFDALQREIDALNTEIEAEERSASSAQARTREGETDGEDPEGDDAMHRAISAERERVSTISNLCRQFDADPSEYIRSGSTVDQVRAAILDNLVANGSPVHVQVTRDEQEAFRECASDAMMMRAGVNVENPAEGSEQLRGMSLRDLAIECLSREGRSANELLRMSPDDLYADLCRQFYNPSAAFPAIMDQTIRKSIVELYNKVPTTFQAFCTEGTLRDFKSTPDHEYVIGGVGDFLLVPENGEIKADKPSTALLPSRKLDTYGKQFSMSRQAFINDDIGFLTEVPGLYATKAKKTIDKQVYKLLFEGKTQATYDGVALFHSSHANLMGTDSAPSQTAIQNAILQMQKQTDQFGEAIYMTPRTLVVGVGYEFDLAVILHSAQVTGSSNNDINPLYNYPLQVVQSPILNSLTGAGNKMPWFLIADPSSAHSIQVDYLNGQKTPTVRRMEVPGTLGFVWDIYLDWGISVRDFRGMVRNDGATI